MGNKKDSGKKKKIRLKGLLIIILFFYLIFSCLYYLWTKPIRTINIEGNYILSDSYLIDYIDIEDVSIIKINKKDVKNKLLELDLINEVKVSKNYFGILNISIEEDKILFYNWNNKKIILSSGREIEYNKNYLGVPVLINYVPDSVYDELIKKLNKIEEEILSLVSEIEYSPSIVDGKTVDENRFLFRMNDGNIVYINTINIEKLNKYLNIYEAVVSKNGNVNGCLYLDSNSDSNYFNNCDVLEKEVGEEDGNTES